MQSVQRASELREREDILDICINLPEAGVLDCGPGCLHLSLGLPPLWCLSSTPTSIPWYVFRGARPKKSSPVIKVEIAWKCLEDSSGEFLPAIRVRIKFLGQINGGRKLFGREGCFRGTAHFNGPQLFWSKKVVSPI
ncbi:uncharacterized protein CEXT_452581 [Caerostris extrusa]|uniref:Uncharacterized protein n=1 Tax=Caerostris extrusa TaxID=172846 RepID=A0AAV4PIZ3_CAEEX|nr:uncharacterized protein CEXT_452581 [Caerostris extrusa]